MAGAMGLALALLLWVIVYVVLSLYMAFMFEDEMGHLGGTSLFILPLFTSLAIILTSIWLILRGVMCDWSIPAVLAGAVVCVGVNQAIHTLMSPTLGPDFATVTMFGVGNVALIGTSIFIGKLIGGRVEAASWVIPIILVLAAVDCWSVYFGPTGHVAEAIAENPAESEIAHRFMLWYPVPPSGPEGLAVQPAIGFGDLVVGALLLEVARRFGMRVGLSLVALGGAILAAMVTALYASVGVPALPFMGAAFLLANVRRYPVIWREVITCAVFLGILFALLIFVVNPVAGALMPPSP